MRCTTKWSIFGPKSLDYDQTVRDFGLQVQDFNTITLTLRLDGITDAMWDSESEEVSLCVSHFKFWTLRVDFGHVGVNFLANITRFWASASPFFGL